jgi:hypothetical protein
MFQRLHLPSSLLFGAIAAFAFCVPMIYFIISANYTDTWWLFLGNLLFLIVVSIYMLVFTKRKYENPNTTLLLAAGHLVTVIGCIIASLFAFILLIIFVPGIFGSGASEKVLEGAPAHTEGGKTDGLIMFVFMSAIIGNVSAGSAVSLVLAYTAKRDQTKETVLDEVKVKT